MMPALVGVALTILVSAVLVWLFVRSVEAGCAEFDDIEEARAARRIDGGRP